MLGSADCRRSCLPCGFFKTLVGTRDRRSAVGADRIDIAASSVADRVRKFSGAAHPDWHRARSRIVAQPNSRELRAALDRKNLLQPLYLAAAVPRNHSASAATRNTADIPAEYRRSIRLRCHELLPARASIHSHWTFVVCQA